MLVLTLGNRAVALKAIPAAVLVSDRAPKLPQNDQLLMRTCIKSDVRKSPRFICAYKHRLCSVRPLTEQTHALYFYLTGVSVLGLIP